TFEVGGNWIEQFVAVDQTNANVDWTEYTGSLLVPSEPTSIIMYAQMGKDATGTVWFDNIGCGTTPWSMGVFGGDAENPVGWLNWSSGSDIGFANLISDPAAHSGSYSTMLYEADTLGDEMVFYSEPVAVTADKWFKISVWARTDSLNTDPAYYGTNVTADRIDDRLGVNFFFHRTPIMTAWDLTGGDQFFYFNQLADTLLDWKEYVAIVQAPSDAAGVSMRARFNPFPTGYVWYDDFRIEELAEVITLIEDEPTPISNLVPHDFVLQQNYPNPFNPETIIEFKVPEYGPVVLNIFNTLGQKIKTLVNDHRAPGTYQVFWDGRDDHGNYVATGMYLYQLRGENALITKKMFLIK
ncbi:MAG: T9SS type A sorting domain-containing protein, partial [Calditrichia bacterium]|nr:T9SS type A sorting domain-containing protein [Calditrichia bacterium]